MSYTGTLSYTGLTLVVLHMTGRKDPTITVRIPKDLRDKLQKASERDGLSRSQHVITALRNYLGGSQEILTTPAVRSRAEARLDERLTQEDLKSIDPRLAVEPAYHCPRHPSFKVPSPNAKCSTCGRKVTPVDR